MHKPHRSVPTQLAVSWQRAQMFVSDVKAKSVATLFFSLIVSAAGATPTPQEEVMLSAAKAGNVALYRAMLRDGANYGARDDSGKNAVVIAALSDRDEMLRKVLTHKIDLDARESLGMTALAIATAHNALHAVDRLLRAGANPDIADASGVTPLASALRLGRPQLATRLLAAGADPRHADAARELLRCTLQRSTGTPE